MVKLVLKSLFAILIFVAYQMINKMNSNTKFPYSLPELPYSYTALEPAIDARTMEIHHSKHHNAYITNLNKACEDNNLGAFTLVNLLKEVSTLPAAVRNNGGGHYNHSLFWQTLTNDPASKALSPELEAAISSKFGSLDAFKAEFERAAATRFGSGWAWLIVDTNGELAVTSTPNQDNPLMDVADKKGQPLLGLDVWEHAYYLNYQNRRPDYISAFWSVVNWSEVSRLYQEAKNNKAAY